MKAFIFAIIVSYLSRSAFCASFAKCSTDYDFDYMLLSVEWPESFCETEKCVKHTDKWTIHGNWPQYNSGKYPSNCCFDKEYRPQQLESIKSELVQYWKTLKAGGTNDEFWSHEWEKHGTCAKESSLLNGELNYFKNTLEVFKTLSLDKWLADAHITPSESKVYSVTDFHSAIVKGLGHNVQLDCLSKKHNSSPIISEIHICLNKNTLKPQDCPNNLSDENCGRNSIAYLPSNQ